MEYVNRKLVGTIMSYYVAVIFPMKYLMDLCTQLLTWLTVYNGYNAEKVASYFIGLWTVLVNYSQLAR